MSAKVQRLTFPWICLSVSGPHDILDLQCYVSKSYQQYLVYQAGPPVEALLHLLGNINERSQRCITENSTSTWLWHGGCLSVGMGIMSWTQLIPRGSHGRHQLINQESTRIRNCQVFSWIWNCDLMKLISIYLHSEPLDFDKRIWRIWRKDQDWHCYSAFNKLSHIAPPHERIYSHRCTALQFHVTRTFATDLTG